MARTPGRKSIRPQTEGLGYAGSCAGLVVMLWMLSIAGVRSQTVTGSSVSNSGSTELGGATLSAVNMTDASGGLILNSYFGSAGTSALESSTVYSGSIFVNTGSVGLDYYGQGIFYHTVSGTVNTGNGVENGSIVGATGTGNGTLTAGTGTLTLTSGGSLSNTGTVVFVSQNGNSGSGTIILSGTLQITNTNAVIGSSITLAGAGSVINTNGNNLTLSGTISGAGGLTINNSTGSGTLTLSGTNYFTGATTINSGTVVVNGASGVGAGDLKVNGGTLVLNGNNSALNVGGNFIQSGGVVTFSASSPVQGATYSILTATGTAALGGTLNIDVSGSTPGQPFTLMLTANKITGTFANISTKEPDTVDVSQSLSADNRSLTITVKPLMAFSAWKALHHITSGATESPMRDGVPNLLKYYYHINPESPLGMPDRAVLPTMGVDTTTNPGTRYLTLTYRKYGAMTGVATTVETSSDMKTWTSVAPDISQQVGTDATTGDPLVEVGIIMPTQVTCQFMRLKVSQP